jgi:hypothetical protein
MERAVPSDLRLSNWKRKRSSCDEVFYRILTCTLAALPGKECVPSSDEVRQQDQPCGRHEQDSYR